MKHHYDFKLILENTIQDSERSNGETNFIKVNAIKFVGRTLAGCPNNTSPEFLEPLFNVLFYFLEWEGSMSLLKNFNYTEDEVTHYPFDTFHELNVALPKNLKILKDKFFISQSSIDARIREELSLLGGDAASHLQPPRSMAINQKNAFPSCQSKLEFLSYLRQFIEEYMEHNVAYAANTDQEQTLMAFANSFSLQSYEIDLIRLLAVMKYMDPIANFFQDYLKISPGYRAKAKVAKRVLRPHHQHSTPLLDSCYQEGDLLNMAIFAN